MQRKFRVPDQEWQAFCDSLPPGVSPSDRLRELVMFQASPLDQILGVEEAAALWGLSPGYIKNLCAAGKLKAKKIGKTWIIDANQTNQKQEEPS